jgi:hypothetical protein
MDGPLALQIRRRTLALLARHIVARDSPSCITDLGGRLLRTLMGV